jgi:hypothetical protein
VEKLDFYFYYKLAKVSVVDGNELPEISPAPDLDFERDVFQADCLIIEMNEQQMSEPDNRVGNFVRDALEHRPKAKG